MMSLTSCHNAFFSGYKTIENHSWDKRDTVTFELPLTNDRNGITAVDMQVGVRTLGEFQYSKIYLKVELCTNDSVIDCDTVSVPIFDEKGKPYGSGFPYIEAVAKGKSLQLNPYTAYNVKITHIMRMNSIEGVYDVGVELNNEQ